MTGRVLIHVQHLLGTGHLRRAAAIGTALADTGLEVEILSGGPLIDDLDAGRARLVQLPALRTADTSFKRLIDHSGQPVDDSWRIRRRDALLARFAEFQPHVLITELFPFGRRVLEFELLPLLEAARAATPRPLILCSLRDVLIVPGDPRKVERAIARAHTWYDCVLVHGDASLIDLPASYPAARELADKIVYTGYVVSPPSAEAPPGEGEGEIIVSAGGGAVGARLFDAALGARLAGTAADRTWRLLLGADLPSDVQQRLMTPVPGRNVIVQPARRDFPSLLRRCHVSVSQAGYNTAMDILTAQARAVLVPFAGGGETEQAQRAAAFAAKGWAQVIPEPALDAAQLAAAIDRAAQHPAPAIGDLKCNGAAETARLVQRLLSNVEAVGDRLA